jgi:DNA-directed RNA polymerase subunit F
MEHSCFVLDCNYTPDRLIHSGNLKQLVCGIHFNQRERVSSALKNTLNFLNTFSEIFSNQIKSLIQEILTTVKNTNSEFESLKKRINQILKKIYSPQNEKVIQDPFFDKIFNVSSETFEKEIKKLEKFPKDDCFNVLDKDLKSAQVEEISKAYKQELGKISKFFDTLQIDPEVNSEFLSLVTEKGRKNHLHRFCRNTEKIESFFIILFPSVYYPVVCDLPDSTVFIGGGMINDDLISKKCYIFNPVTSKLDEKQEMIDLTLLTGTIYYQGACYCFGGRINGISFNKAKKFNFHLNSWEYLSDVPCESSIHNPIIHNELIWMCGYLYEYIFYYNVKRNCYFRLSIQVPHQRKSLFKLKEKLFILINNKIYQIRGSTLEEFCPTKSISVISSIETEDSVVFHDGSWIYKFTPSIKFVGIIDRLSYNPVKPHW